MAVHIKVPTADGDVSDGPAFDCHVDDASLTWVHRVTAASITHERPDVDTKGELQDAFKSADNCSTLTGA